MYLAFSTDDADFGGIPKRLKGRAWKARRHVTVCEGSNPSSSAKHRQDDISRNRMSFFISKIPILKHTINDMYVFKKLKILTDGHKEKPAIFVLYTCIILARNY